MITAETQILRDEFLLLVNREEEALRRAAREKAFIWWEWENEQSRLPDSFLPFDAALDVFAQSCVRTGPNWKAIGHTLPGMQLVLRRAIDALAETFVEVALFDRPGEFALNSGSLAALDIAHEALGQRGVRFAHVFRFPVRPVVELLRSRAAEAGIELPHRLAPAVPPAWRRTGASSTTFGGLPIDWAALDESSIRSPLGASLSEGTITAGAA